jgi:hypothetical protein
MRTFIALTMTGAVKAVWVCAVVAGLVWEVLTLRADWITFRSQLIKAESLWAALAIMRGSAGLALSWTWHALQVHLIKVVTYITVRSYHALVLRIWWWQINHESTIAESASYIWFRMVSSGISIVARGYVSVHGYYELAMLAEIIRTRHTLCVIWRIEVFLATIAGSRVMAMQTVLIAVLTLVCRHIKVGSILASWDTET